MTYGTFAPDHHGQRFGSPAQVEQDFSSMAAQGINAVRTYTAPPDWVLDAALCHGLRVMVGVAWDQHVAFLADRGRAAEIEASVRAQAASCAGHPAVLCFAVGNEIPTPIVRWHGRRRVERFIERLCSAVREEDPDALLTYVNYPSTEYLRLPFVDFVSFNLYLDDGPSVSRYLARLQNLAGEKPLVLAELGADSRRQGEEVQARTVAAQIDAAFAAGCAGTFVFAWTDEWHRAEDEVLDWDFGITDRSRTPKPALRTLARAYERVGHADPASPLVSVVVCTHNGAATLRECLEGLFELRYPAYEVIVVNDGSTDDTTEIAAGFPVRLITTGNDGLSAARNVGLAAARGEIVAYLDDDARPDPEWLRFLVEGFASADHVAIGGPNLPPDDDGAIAACVANAPGGPTHVLVSDDEAEHIPGCNMAYRRDALTAIGGFDPQFRTAGDDVDVCWRLQERGSTLGFHPAAVVWHRRRSSLRTFWRQQHGYGRAEAFLERKWPERYSRRGHLRWAGRLYDRASSRGFRPTRIYQGTWGTGAFQPEEPIGRGRMRELVGAPDWHLLVAVLASLSLLGLAWHALLWSLPLLALAAAASLTEAIRGGLHADFGRHGSTPAARLCLGAVTTLLHLLQPSARLSGRLSHGLTPWRQRRTAGVTLPLPVSRAQWHEAWVPPQKRVLGIERAARNAGGRVLRGGPFSRWDLELSGGWAGSARLLVAVEEHGRGRQLVRCHVWPRVSPAVWRLCAVLPLLLGYTILTHEWWLVGALAGLAAVLATIAAWECCIAVAGALAALDHGVASTVSTSQKPPEFVQPRTRRFAAAGAENR